MPNSPDDSRRRGESTAVHLVTALGVGVVATVVTGAAGGWRFAAIVGWDAIALVVIIWTWAGIWHHDPASTARHAVREDPARPIADLLLVGASVASLLGVGFLVVAGGNSKGVTKGLLVGLAILTVVVSWAVVHTTFTLRYARLFYAGAAGGLNFHQDADGQPQFSDFAYLAITVGMTFQVSDTEVNTAVMRATILRHALLSYLFGVVIIAIMINLVAGLAK